VEYQTFENLQVKEIQIALAKPLILENHYSKSWNNAFGKYCFGIYRDEMLLGVAVYGLPMQASSWSQITTLDSDKCVELNRLWTSDELLKNTETWFLSKTFTMLRSYGIELIQSFADGRLGVGTTYQAANFGYYGSHSTIFHQDQNGFQIHDVGFHNTERHKAMVKKNLQWIRGELNTFEVKTYRYLYPLTKKAKKATKVTPLPYPKERVPLTYKKDFEPPNAQIARCAAICQALDWRTEYLEFFDYLKTKVAEPYAVIEKEKENKWVQKLLRNKVDSALF